MSCYCSASHTDNISTDEHDSLRDSNTGHCALKGLQSSDSGTDLNEYAKYDSETAWNKFWSLNGETIIWKSWISKYSAYINPEYLDNAEESGEDAANNTEHPSDITTCDSKQTVFSFEERDIERLSKPSSIADKSLVTIDEDSALTGKPDVTKRQDIALKNRMLVRNLSGSDSYDKIHGDVSEGWNPLSPLSIEYEAEAERLLSSRCGSHASSSLRTLDSMTNVTRMTVSSIDLSQSSQQSSESVSSVSSLQSSLTSTSSEDANDGDHEQEWNALWKRHYEEEYLEQYNKFVFSHKGFTQDTKVSNVNGKKMYYL